MEKESQQQEQEEQEVEVHFVDLYVWAGNLNALPDAPLNT